MLSGATLLDFAKSNLNRLQNAIYNQQSETFTVFLDNQVVTFDNVTRAKAEELKAFIQQHRMVECSEPRYGSDDAQEHWKGYNIERIKAEQAATRPRLPIKIALFSKATKDSLNSTNRVILDLGCSTGVQHAPSVKDGITVIGYDNNEIAISTMRHHGVIARNVNLNDCTDGKLRYEQQLKSDLAQPCDIFLIEILEFINNDALILLMYTLIDNAKSGSFFYYAGKAIEPDSNAIPVGNFQKRRDGYIPSFFGPRTDIQTMHRSICITHINGLDVPIESLIVRKI